MDVSGSPVKGEVEGIGHEGKLEKIAEGVIEKVAANGHVEAELQVCVPSNTNKPHLISTVLLQPLVLI